MNNFFIYIDRYFNTKLYMKYNKIKIYIFKLLNFKNNYNNIKVDNYYF